MIIRSRFLQGLVSLSASTIIALVAVALLGVVVPGLLLLWMAHFAPWDGLPGEGLILVFSTVLATGFSLYLLMALSIVFYRKRSPAERQPIGTPDADAAPTKS